jgi:glycyl-tRNA synthetase beta chain
MSAPLLLEIGCEEIPARMIASAAADLRARVVAALDQAGLPHGEASAWGGTRRLAVRVEGVAATLAGRDETVLGPPASAAFAPDGSLTPAGAGFAKKQGIDPSALQKVETDKGVYAGFRRSVVGRTLEQVLAEALPASVAAMAFPKTMRWGDGTHRWVRPVHWVVALHGGDVLKLEILGAASGRNSDGHRFLAPGPVNVEHPDRYVDALRAARVLIDPADRRVALAAALDRAAASVSGTPVPDAALLDELVDLVEWPGVVVGRFDPAFLDLPREILVTTLRHHQKSFSVQGPSGLLPAFLSVANTDRDPAGHVRRGNEWVVVGRLEDARFFWGEDRKRPLGSRVVDLKRVTFHKKLGSYEEKTRRNAALTEALAMKLGRSNDEARLAVEAARVAKADLSTGLVGEFPELQGVVGGLLLRAEGAAAAVCEAVADHYRPAGPEDAMPRGDAGCMLAIADRLDTIAGLIDAGETPTGSRDPFGLRRAASGVFRILAERRWPLSMADLFQLSGQSTKVYAFLQERLNNWLLDRGFTANEIEAVRRPKVSPTDFDQWSLDEVLSRLTVLGSLRSRADFRRLVELTKRVDNILEKQPEVLARALASGASLDFHEAHPSALALGRAHDAVRMKIVAASEAHDFPAVIEHVSTLIEPVSRFFDDVLVLDPKDPAASRSRCELLAHVRSTVTRDFDIRELAGQADAKR